MVGSYFTGGNVYNNYKKFTNFGSVIMERHVEFSTKRFPKITYCPNSIHSRARLEKKYNFIYETLLQIIYGGCKDHCDRKVSTKLKFRNLSIYFLLDFGNVWPRNCGKTTTFNNGRFYTEYK